MQKKAEICSSHTCASGPDARSPSIARVCLVRWRGAGQPVVVPSRVGLAADRWRDGCAALDRPPPARQGLAKRARLSGLQSSLSPRAEALWRSAGGLPEYGVDHLHDEALLRLGQALDALDLLQKLWRGPALRTLRLFPDQFFHRDGERTGKSGQHGITVTVHLIDRFAKRETRSHGELNALSP